jgi:hypothetical protein
MLYTSAGVAAKLPFFFAPPSGILIEGGEETMKRFLLVFLLATLVRFYTGEESISFLWFIILYLPMINWSVYWIFFSVRVALNRLRGFEWISVPRIRQIYVWYLNIPGSLVLAEVVYQGYLYNR